MSQAQTAQQTAMPEQLPQRECRYVDGLELRAARAGAQSVGELKGYAILYNSLSEPIMFPNGRGFFREIIQAGAARRAIATQDVLFYPDHESRAILGRTSSGTLRLTEDTKGVAFGSDLPDTTVGRDSAVSVGRGDVRGMSFEFYVLPEGEEWDLTTTPPTRTVRSINILDCVTLAGRPAYTDTSVALRSLDAAIAAAQSKPEEASEPPSAALPEQRADVGYISRERERLRLMQLV